MLNLIVLSVRHRMEDNYRLLGVYENKGMVAHAVNVFLEEKSKRRLSDGLRFQARGMRSEREQRAVRGDNDDL